VIIDTGRNGRGHAGGSCSSWCNVRGAGVGRAPTLRTAPEEVVDAYLWLKTPGESDGCTKELPSGGECPRFDASCGSLDSIGSIPGEPRAPEAGGLFELQLLQLAEMAEMAWGEPGSLLASGVVRSAAAPPLAPSSAPAPPPPAPHPPFVLPPPPRPSPPPPPFTPSSRTGHALEEAALRLRGEHRRQNSLAIAWVGGVVAKAWVVEEWPRVRRQPGLPRA